MRREIERSLEIEGICDRLSVIDYVLVNEEIREKVVNLEMKEQIGSNNNTRDGEGKRKRDEEGRELFKTEEWKW